MPDTKLQNVTFDDATYQGIRDRARALGKIRTAVIHPVDAHSVTAATEAAKEGLITPILIGPKARITAAADACGADITGFDIIDVPHSHAAAQAAARMAAAGEVQALMKGALHTDELLSVVVAAESGLRTERRISHAYVISMASYHKPLIVTDAAINIAPTLEEKADICRNAINLWRALFGDERKPKVAILSAVETILPRVPSTLDAACLTQMANRGQITGGIVDGPLAFDNAISARAAADKGITSPVAGDADILVVPNLEAGNILAKEMTFLGNAAAAGIGLGARVPIILTSRADSVQTRLLSCVTAIFLSHARQEGLIK